jgi:uncharacterized membrane protein
MEPLDVIRGMRARPGVTTLHAPRVWDTGTTVAFGLFALVDHRIEIVADRGINNESHNRSGTQSRRMESAFRAGNFKAGTLQA